MGRNPKVSFEQKLDAVKKYLDSNGSTHTIAQEYGISQMSFRQWIRKYKAFGISGLKPSRNNVGYSGDLKMQAVLDYIGGKGSQEEICSTYKIHSRTQLQNWISLYNSCEKIKSSRTGGKLIMTKGRSTTFEERIEIVKYCIEHNSNYNETAEKYQVSYQQVRSWTVKYDESGVDALTDRRGKRKSEDQLTEVERLKAQNKLLEAKNKHLEMENELLKKLEEIERGWS